jgi:hypothetical protein
MFAATITSVVVTVAALHPYSATAEAASTGFVEAVPGERVRGLGLACPNGTPEDGFSDVPPDSPHEPAVDCAAHWAITSGIDQYRYAPASGVSRAQAASFVGRLLDETGVRFPTEVPDAFRDDDNLGHEAMIDRMATLGIARGRSVGVFDPAASVTRGQFAALLDRAYVARAGESLMEGPDRFADDETSVHEQSLNRLAQAGVVSGTGAGQVRPADVVRRDQLASMIARFIDLLVERGLAKGGTRGDVSGDGSVGPEDIERVIGGWGSAGPDGDANNDGRVDAIDVAIVLAHWPRQDRLNAGTTGLAEVAVPLSSFQNPSTSLSVAPSQAAGPFTTPGTAADVMFDTRLAGIGVVRMAGEPSTDELSLLAFDQTTGWLTRLDAVYDSQHGSMVALLPRHSPPLQASAEMQAFGLAGLPPLTIISAPTVVIGGTNREIAAQVSKFLFEFGVQGEACLSGYLNAYGVVNGTQWGLADCATALARHRGTADAEQRAFVGSLGDRLRQVYGDERGAALHRAEVDANNGGRLIGRGDAIKHCTWAAVMSRDFGPGSAAIVLNAHEVASPNPWAEAEMDRRNNETGVGIGAASSSDEDAFQECRRRALGESGGLSVVLDGHLLVSTDLVNRLLSPGPTPRADGPVAAHTYRVATGGVTGQVLVPDLARVGA